MPKRPFPNNVTLVWCNWGAYDGTAHRIVAGFTVRETAVKFAARAAVAELLCQQAWKEEGEALYEKLPSNAQVPTKLFKKLLNPLDPAASYAEPSVMGGARLTIEALRRRLDPAISTRDYSVGETVEVFYFATVHEPWVTSDLKARHTVDSNRLRRGARKMNNSFLVVGDDIPF